MGDVPSAAEIARALKGTKAGAGWVARCPAHDDKSPSLSIGMGDDGKFKVHCHAGCEFRDILAALQQRGIVPEIVERSSPRQATRHDQPPPHIEIPAGPEEPAPSAPNGSASALPPGAANPPHINKPHARVISYEYVDAGGGHFTWSYRYEDEAGKRVDTRQTRNEDTPGGPCPLYRLPSIVANPDKPILVVEGEKSADCAHDIFGADFEATTSKQGAQSPGKSDWSCARGRRVVIWPDADVNGGKYAAAVKDLCLKAGAASVKIVDVEGLPDKWDLADPPPPGEGAEVYDRITRHVGAVRLNIRDVWASPPPHRKWLVQDHLSEGRIALLVGEGGIGKTKLALQLCYSIAEEQPEAGTRSWFEGGPEINGFASPAVYLSWEDDHDELQRRLLDALPEGVGSEELERRLGGRFQAIDAGDNGPIWQLDQVNTFGTITEFGLAVREFCESVKARILVIDALDSAFAASEIDRPSVRGFLAHWDTWGRGAGCVPLLLAHPNKGGDAYSGSTAWRNGVRTMITLTSDVPDRAVFAVDKINYAAKPSSINLMNWKWWRAAEAEDWGVPSEEDVRLDDDVLEFLRRTQSASKRMVREGVRGANEKVDTALDRLERLGSIVVKRARSGNDYSLADGE